MNAKCQKYLEAREPLTSGHAILGRLIGMVLANEPNMLEKVQEFDADFCTVVQGFLEKKNKSRTSTPAERAPWR